MSDYFIKNNCSVLNILKQIANCQEINVLSLFLTAQDKDSLKDLINFMETNKISKMDLDFIKTKFELN